MTLRFESMKLFYPLLTLLPGLLFWSCSKDEEPETRDCDSRYNQKNVVLPTQKTFDIDQDGKSDFMLELEERSGDRIGSPGIAWYTVMIQRPSYQTPLKGHTLIANHDGLTGDFEQIWFTKGHALHLDSLDTTLSRELKTPQKVVNLDVPLMTRYSCYSDALYFEESWSVQLDTDQVVDGSGIVYMASYNAATGSLGWIKFQLDVDLGTLIYIEHKYTDANSLVIGE